MRRLAAVNLPALAASLLLVCGLLLEGANTAASAALFSASMAGALVIAALFSPRSALARVWRTHWLSILAIVIFITLAIATTAPASLFGLSPHPTWRDAPDAPLSLAPYRSLEGLVALLSACAAFLLGALLAQEREARSWSARWLIGAGALYALAGFALFYAGRSGPRLDVGVSSANVAAIVFAAFALIAVASIARAWRGADGDAPAHPSHGALAIFNAPLSLGVLLIMFAALLLTASRGGLVCALLGLIVLVILLASRGLKASSWRAGALAAPLLLIAAALVALFVRGGDDVMARFALAEDDWLQRQLLIDAHWPLVLERPWLGHGLNTYHELNIQALTQDNWRALEGVGSAHNIYVQTLEETGIVGLCLLSAALGAPILMALARVIGAKPGAEWAGAAFAISLILLAHGLVDFALQTPAVAALYAYLLGAWSTPTAR